MFPRNIFIFHAGALGDFVQTWPLGLALGRLYPQSRIIYVTQKQKGLLAERALKLESIDSETGWHHLFGDPAGLPEICRKKLDSAQIVFTFIAKPGDAWIESVVSLALSAQVIPVEPGPTAQIVASLAARPIVQSAMTQILASIAQRGIPFAAPADPGPIAIHPGSGSPAKCWPLDSYLRLIENLHHAGHRCRILLGEVELERMPADEIRRLHLADETVEPATYLDLLRELQACSAFVGNDSGPGQLAGIIGLPTVSLFGPTDPAIWKPLGPRVTVLRAEPIDRLSAQEVAGAILNAIPQHSHELLVRAGEEHDD